MNRFAVAAEAIGMWSFAAAQAHIEICAKIAGMALNWCSNAFLLASCAWLLGRQDWIAL